MVIGNARALASCQSGFIAQRGVLLGLRALYRLVLLHRLTLRAGFNPGQPRVPAGHGRESGRWAAINVDIPPRASAAGKGPRLRPPSAPARGIGDNGGPPLEDPPEVPIQRPAAARQRNHIAKAIGHWVARAAARRMLGPLGIFLDAIEVISWLNELAPDIQSFFDKPKSLTELRRLARDPKPGYEIHHIVEKTSAAADGFPEAMIEGPENLVRIPKYKHHLINRWFSQKNRLYEDLSPRQYLRGRSWDERLDIGIQRLKQEGGLY